jgi:two-component system cell cycle sensor histidine kinase/response regulator CckA
MPEKPNHEKLNKKLMKLEKEAAKGKQAQDMLKRKITELDSFINNIPDMAWIKDSNSRFVAVNKAFSEAVGIDQESLINRTCEICFGKERAKKFREDDLKVMRGRRQEVIEEKIIDSQNNMVWLETVKSPILDHSEIAIGTVGISRDISKRKKAEEKLRQAHDELERIVKVRTAELEKANKQLRLEIEERKQAQEEASYEQNLLQTLLNNIPDYVYFKDKNRRFVSASNSFCDLLGCRMDDIIGKKDEDLFPEETAAETASDDRHVINTGMPLVNKEEGGESIGEGGHWVLTTKLPWRDYNGNIIGLFGISREITDRKRAEEALLESKEKIARYKKMESLGLLAGGVAHDLNNILSGIVSYPELLLLQLPEDSQFRNSIKTIKKSGDRAVAVVNDLLTVARGVATTREPLNLNDLIDDYLNSPEFNELKKLHPTVAVKTEIDRDLLNIGGSHVHLSKVLMNLLSNAFEAIKGSGNVTILTANRYLDKPLKGYDDINPGEYAVLTVSDDGLGISSGDLERIFEPFYTKKVLGRSGTGLGLAVVWNVVQDHEGYIDVISNANGTTFKLFFPITREERSMRNLSIPFKDLIANGEKILVIDDVKSQREISCKMLETLGYKTDAVSSGEEAVEYFKKNTADLILLDMIMEPGINGRETYKRIIKIHPNQKAIIVSGFAETDEVRETQKLGAGKFIKKPLTIEKLGLVLKEELGK